MNINPSGLLLIDKPSGITSFDCIRRLRRQTGVKKIGHAGTLDPMATGLMLMLFGTATKQASKFIKLDKTYLAEITLGSTSTTGDREGELVKVSDRVPAAQEVSDVLASLVGEMTQVPPQYSAIKIGGVRAYKSAREGKKVDIPSRQVMVYSIKLDSYSYPHIKLETKVSSGTYVRSLAEDIGAQLGCGGHLSALRRISISNYDVIHAHSLDEVDETGLLDKLKPLGEN